MKEAGSLIHHQDEPLTRTLQGQNNFANHLFRSIQNLISWEKLFRNDNMCRPRNITRHCGTLSQSRVQEQQQDLEEDVSTTATTGVPQSLPLLIGPIQVIPIADTLAIDFIPPPYFVVEVDDGIETLGWKEEEEEEIKNGIQERRVGTLWPLGLWSTSTSTSTTPTLCVKRYGSTRRTSSHNDWSAQMMQERKESNSAQLFVCALFFILTFLMTK